MERAILKIIEEEFTKEREYDAPCCDGSLGDLLERINTRIKEECPEAPQVRCDGCGTYHPIRCFVRS